MVVASILPPHRLVVPTLLLSSLGYSPHPYPLPSSYCLLPLPLFYSIVGLCECEEAVQSDSLQFPERSIQARRNGYESPRLAVDGPYLFSHFSSPLF